MENKTGFFDVLTNDDIDFLISTCMRTIHSENDNVAIKNEKNLSNNVHVDYSTTHFETNLGQAPNDGDLLSLNAQSFGERSVDFEKNYIFRNGSQHAPVGEERHYFHRNCADHEIKYDFYQNCTSSTHSSVEHQSQPIRQEQQSQSMQPTQKRTKRFRTAFTARQMLTLEREYQSCQYVEKVRRAELAISIGLSEQKIKTWFQNRRMKTKREGKEQKSPKYSQTVDSNCPSTRPYGEFPWTIYQNNCAMQLHQEYQQNCMTDVRETVHRW